jgi:cytochrome o ubiquinol oxidase subunit IV
MSEKQGGLLKLYISGFILSVALTLVAFMMVSDKLLHGWSLIIALMFCAVIQLMVQLIFFLHLDQEKKPRWNLQAFLFMALVLLIIVIGSLWIMNNLNYHMMSPEEIKQDELIN